MRFGPTASVTISNKTKKAAALPITNCPVRRSRIFRRRATRSSRGDFRWISRASSHSRLCPPWPTISEADANRVGFSMPTWKGIVGRGFRSQEFQKYVGTLSFSDWRPQFVVLHNTSEPRLSQWHSTPGEQRMRNLEDYYKGLGWSAGPHLFVADDLIWVFTPLTTSGTHSPSWNAISWGVEMVGEYEEEPFDPRVKQ